MSQSEPQTQSPEMRKLVPWIIYIIFFTVLNETVFNVSTPNIANQFHLQPSQVGWVISIFIVTFSLGSAVFGKLSDMFSLKKLIMIGIITYVASSLLGFAFHNNYAIVIVFRAIQGAGASAIPSLGMIIIARYFTKEERGKLFGIITSAISFAVGFGPVLGGFITGTFDWFYLFLIPLVTVVALPFIHKILPYDKRNEGKLDILGTTLIGIAVLSLILFLTGTHWYYLVICIISIGWFTIHIRRANEPFVEPSLFANSLYRNGLVIGFLTNGIAVGITFASPLMLHELYQLPTQTIGLIMFPGAFTAVIFGTVAGNMTVKKGSHFVVYLGLGLIALGLFLESSVVGNKAWLIAAALVVVYSGISFLQTALVESITIILPTNHIGVGMGFFNLSTYLAGAVGAALVSKTIESSFLKFALHPLISDVHAYLYSNLLLIFTLIVIFSTLLYYFSFGRRGKLAQDLR